MNEIAGATLVIQIFEFIRRSPRPSSLRPYLFVRVSTALNLLVPLYRLPLSSPHEFFSVAGWRTRGRASFAISVYRCLTCKCVYVRVFLSFPFSFSSRFGNNKYAHFTTRFECTGNNVVPEFSVRERLFDSIVSFTIRTFILERSANNNVGIVEISTNSEAKSFFTFF